MSSSQNKPNRDEFGRKICTECGKTAGEVKFTETKNVCNVCRANKVAEYEDTPERIVNKWSVKMGELSNVFLKGKSDPCEKCLIETVCRYCAVFQAKMMYMHPLDTSTKLFIDDYNKNLLDNIRKVI